MRWYRNFLCNFCNPRTGQPFWFWVELAGFLMMFSWLAAALPQAGAIFGINWLGQFVSNEQGTLIVAYAGLFSVAGKIAEWYFAGIFFGIVIVKLGMLIQCIGNNYKNGYVYLQPQPYTPLGNWIKF